MMTGKCITANGSSESVKFASISSPDPVSLHENVDSDGRTHGGHHDKIRKGQVDDKHVGLSKEKETVKSRIKRTPKRPSSFQIYLKAMNAALPHLKGAAATANVAKKGLENSTQDLPGS